MNLPYDDGSVVVGTWLALGPAMTKQPSIESLVQVVEKKVAKLEEFAKGWDARLERRFMAEGEMMDERFANLYAYMGKRFDGIDQELKLLREGMKIILGRLT